MCLFITFLVTYLTYKHTNTHIHTSVDWAKYRFRHVVNTIWCLQNCLNATIIVPVVLKMNRFEAFCGTQHTHTADQNGNIPNTTLARVLIFPASRGAFFCICQTRVLSHGPRQPLPKAGKRTFCNSLNLPHVEYLSGILTPGMILWWFHWYQSDPISSLWQQSRTACPKTNR